VQLRLLATRALPFVVSFSLLALVAWWVSPHAVVHAAADLRWQLLLPATVVMVVALYLCDAACLPVVYAVDGRRISFLQSLHVRGLSYLGGAFNYEVGQAGIAWGMARLQDASLLRMLSRSVVLAYHDAVILLAMGLGGSLMSDDGQVTLRRPYIAIALAVTLVVGVVLWNLPERLRLRSAAGRLGAILADWSWSRSLRLGPLRILYFGILVVFAAVALAICKVAVSSEVVLSTVPLVLLAEGLPNFSGLGTRETALLLLIDTPEKGVLVAMSLFWSAGMLVIRLIIGLVHYWVHTFMSAKVESMK
jgi:hypothetical protein